MSADPFDVLIQLLTPTLQRVEAKSACRTRAKPIEVVNMVQMTISWLAGGSYHTVRALAGVSRSAFYHILIEVMKTISEHPRFRISAPTHDLVAMEEAARSFAAISSNNILTGCIGCLDGWLCEIKAPSSVEVPDVSAFFSGHYLTHGINVQAMCDASCRSIGYCFNSPGKASDSVAFKKWQVSEDITQLPFGYYVIGDNAYILAPSMLVPFTKPEIKSPAHSAYNFYISQLRIRIEMSFGLLVNKWQVFQRPLAVDYVHCGLVIKTCMKLHNFCIDNRINASSHLACRTAVVEEYNALESCSYRHTEAESHEIQDVKVKNGLILRQVVIQHIEDFTTWHAQSNLAFGV